MIEKSPEAFRTISEVADDLDLPQHVLRFWETRFSQIKPLKRGGGRRYYRPEDVNLLKGIRHLLYGEGYTIKGVQRILKEQGVRHVASVWEEVPEDAAETVAEVVPAQPVRSEVAEPGPAPVRVEPAPAAADPAPAVRPAGPETPIAAPAQPAPAHPTPAVAAPKLSADDVRQLKAALFELIESKRVLDSVRQDA